MLILRGQRTEVRCLAFSPSGDLLASGGVNKSVRLWDRQTGRARSIFKDHPGIIHALAFAPDGRTLAVGNRHLFLRDVETGAVAVGDVERSHFAGDVCFSPDGRTVVCINQALSGPNRILYGIVTFWDVTRLTTPDGLPSLYGPEDAPPSIPRRNDFAFGLQQALGHLYPVWTTAAAPEQILGQLYPAWATAFSPDGRELALGTANTGVVLWDFAQERFRTALKTGTAVRAVAFSPDGRFLAGAAAEQVQVWDARTGMPVATLRGHQKRVTCLAFAPGVGPSGPALLSGSEDETVRLWDAATGREQAAFRWPTGKLRSVAFAPDGMTAAAAGQNGQIVLWDVDEG